MVAKMDRGARRRPSPRTVAVIEPAVGTYVYCVVAARRRPRVPKRAAGLPGTGPVRVIDLERGLYLVAADAPLATFGAEALRSGLGDVDWVSRAAVAHEAVVESFSGAPAVLPMKLFTIFNNDERAAGHVRADRARIDGLVRRLGGHDEWGVRVTLDRAAAARRRAEPSRQAPSGLAYLQQKKAQRDAAAELVDRARSTVASLYERFAAKARSARRRPASELPEAGGTLLLDAAFLVPRRRAATFRALVSREARARSADGYVVTLTGPWPPYSFVQD
jgi:hypothetical protein